MARRLPAWQTSYSVVITHPSDIVCFSVSPVLRKTALALRLLVSAALSAASTVWAVSPITDNHAKGVVCERVVLRSSS